MYCKAILAVMVFIASGFASTRAQQPATASTEEQAIRKNVDDYCAAFNRGDVDAVMAFWANDADYIDAEGNTHRGNQAIAALFKDSSENLQGYKLGLEIQSLRLVDPEVAIEDGVATLADPDGGTSSGQYTAVWVKSGDQWLVKSARELPSAAVPNPARNADYVEPLAWLVGDWKSEDDGPAVNLQCRWALDKNFVVQEYTVAAPEGNELRVTQWVGFDPETGQLKSWTFDSKGGHGEALWTREGNTWQAEASGVLPGGRIGTAVNAVRYVDDTHMEWSSTGRSVEGQPMPDAKVKFVRITDSQ